MGINQWLALEEQDHPVQIGYSIYRDGAWQPVSREEWRNYRPSDDES